MHSCIHVAIASAIGILLASEGEKGRGKKRREGVIETVFLRKGVVVRNQRYSLQVCIWSTSPEDDQKMTENYRKKCNSGRCNEVDIRKKLLMV